VSWCPFFLPAALSGIAVAVLDGIAPGLWFRCAAILAALVWVLIRAVGTVPIDAVTVAWDSGAPPENWKAQIDHAERFHFWGGLGGSHSVRMLFDGYGPQPVPLCSLRLASFASASHQ
jgi:hypothetical protein